MLVAADADSSLRVSMRRHPHEHQYLAGGISWVAAELDVATTAPIHLGADEFRDVGLARSDFHLRTKFAARDTALADAVLANAAAVSDASDAAAPWIDVESEHAGHCDVRTGRGVPAHSTARWLSAVQAMVPDSPPARRHRDWESLHKVGTAGQQVTVRRAD